MTFCDNDLIILIIVNCQCESIPIKEKKIIRSEIEWSEFSNKCIKFIYNKGFNFTSWWNGICLKRLLRKNLKKHGNQGCMQAGIDKLHITVFGRANVGKSRLINILFNPKLKKTEPKPGNIKQSGKKSKKLLPDGSSAIIETVVIDPKVELDKNKDLRTIKSLSKNDFVIIVLDAREELYKSETELITFFQVSHVPFLVAINKIEYGTNPHLLSELDALEVTYFELSCKENAGIESFRKSLIHMLPDENLNRSI